MFAYFTLVCYLIVGSVAVRFCLPESVSVSFSTTYLTLLTDAPMKAAEAEMPAAPEMHFAEIKIPVEKKVAQKPKQLKAVVVEAKSALPDIQVLAKNELPFHETIKLEKIEMNIELPSNLVALYKDFSFAETIVAEKEAVVDEVSTSMAAAEESEPEFFEIAPEIKKSEEVKTVETQKENETAVSPEVETQDVADMMDVKTEEPTVAQAEQVEPEFFDYPEQVNKQAPVEPVALKKTEVVHSNGLVAFDYSQAPQVPTAVPTAQAAPTVSKVTTQKPKGIQTQEALRKPEPTPSPEPEAEHGFMGPSSYQASLAIHAIGVDLKKAQNVEGFEVRYQDDLSEMSEDYGSGEVKLEVPMAQPKMTRTVTLLKRGYIPTTTELILEERSSEEESASVSVPLIEEEVFNDLMAPYERNGMVGSLLVELDDETDLAKLDVRFGDVIKLNGDFKRTENEDFRYQLFVGVQAGNAMVSYHRGNGEIVSKIIHIHENEITFDANFYEDVVNEKVRIYEEELLSKESSPLIVSGEQVKVFATNSIAKKINNHTYKMPFGSSHLGGRRYLELNHQSEPVFIGLRDNNSVTVPSENFMRFILSKVEGEKLGSRCLIQVNLNKKIEKFEVASESVAQSLMTSTQVLDTDGKFYDSVSDKTRKIIIIGEGQGTAELSPDAKINIKIQFEDGSVQFLNSYCSPNTYLVEQL